MSWWSYGAAQGTGAGQITNREPVPGVNQTDDGEPGTGVSQTADWGSEDVV